jgi:hypothetical protein
MQGKAHHSRQAMAIFLIVEVVGEEQHRIAQLIKAQAV